jgi:hypothetical protein
MITEEKTSFIENLTSKGDKSSIFYYWFRYKPEREAKAVKNIRRQTSELSSYIYERTVP